MAAAAAIAGMALQTLGNYQAMQEKKKQAEEQAGYLDNQAAFMEKVGKRKLELLEQDQTNFQNTQRRAFAKNNISFSGSALDFLAAQQTQMQAEARFVRSSIKNEIDTIRFRSKALYEEAGAYEKAGFLGLVGGGLQIGGKAAEAYGSNSATIYSRNSGSSSGGSSGGTALTSSSYGQSRNADVGTLPPVGGY